MPGEPIPALQLTVGPEHPVIETTDVADEATSGMMPVPSAIPM
jgi:hypothetical protein